MNLSDFVQDIIDITYKAFSIVFLKPHASIRVRFAPHREALSCTITNDSFGDIDIQELRFITIYNRFVSPESVSSKLPLNVPENKNLELTIPLAELKADLNKNIDDNIDEVEIIDKSGRSFKGRIGKAVMKALAE